ncbi:MAG: hypothetical protein RI907_1855 [Pseudomonadota bacterium]
MNTTTYAQQPQQLFAHCQHAGGWPKLGFATEALGEDLLQDDEQE